LIFLTLWEFHMTKNIGNIERIIRIVGGLVLIALAATGTVGVWGWLGLVPLATGLVGWCPPYSLLGINTCKNKNT
jgi:O-antigen ligase